MRRKWFVRYPFTVDVFAKNGTSFDVLIDGKQSDIMFTTTTRTRKVRPHTTATC